VPMASPVVSLTYIFGFLFNRLGSAIRSTH